jgi:hypothetical protein
MGAGMEFDYERERLDPAIAFYEARSARSKRWFYVLQGTQLVAATLVTARAAWPGEVVPRPVLALVGAAAALAAGFVGLFGWQQQWIRYRATSETLTHEKYLHRAQAGPYASVPGGTLLAERYEAIVSSEHVAWAAAMERVRTKPAEAST